MTITRHYKIEAVVEVPTDYKFPQEIWQDCIMRLKGDTTHSDILLEFVRLMLKDAGIPPVSLGVGMLDWVVT